MISSQFIQSCQSGDENAIQNLVRTYQRPVFQLALSIIDDGQELRSSTETYNRVAAEAEAATRQTFIAAVDRIGRYREGTNFETWLFGIAIQISRQRARSWKTRQWLSGLLRHVINNRPSGQQSGMETPEATPSPQTGAPEPADPRYHAGDLELWNSVRTLEEKLRVPVVLRYYHDFPIAEIAHLLHISEGTVHARLDAAREKIARVNTTRETTAQPAE